jgi:hypothetical protein
VATGMKDRDLVTASQQAVDDEVAAGSGTSDDERFQDRTPFARAPVSR